MLKVYCDTGAYRDDLKSLERDGKVQVFQFKYENKNKHIRHMAAPSCPSWKEINYPWSELSLTWDTLGEDIAQTPSDRSSTWAQQYSRCQTP